MKWQNGCKYLFLFSVLFCFVSCGIKFPLEYPESVKVKTNAYYKFTVADKSFDLNQYFDLNSLLGGTTEESSDVQSNKREADGAEAGAEGGSTDSTSEKKAYDIYKYNPNSRLTKSDTQQFLMKMNMQEIPLDFSSYLENADISAAIQNMNIDKEVTVPEITKQERKQEIDLKVNDTINKLVTFSGFTMAEANIGIEMDDLESKFDSISYKSGKMIVASAYTAINDLGYDVAKLGIPLEFLNNPLYNVKLAGTVGLYYKNTKISEAKFNDNGVAYLSIDDFTVYTSGLCLKFTTQTSIPFISYVSSDSVIQKVSGLTLSEDFSTNFATDFQMGNESALESCQIGEGSLDVLLQQPELWTGFYPTYQISVSGGLDCSVTSENPTADLKDKTFVNKDIKAEATVTFKLKNASIVFYSDNGEAQNPFVQIGLEIKSIKSATVKLEESYNTSFTENYALPEEAVSMVKRIKWNPSGVKLNIANTLPAGNDISITLDSAFLGFVNKTETITAGNPELKIDVLCDADWVTELGTDPGQFSTVDVTANVNFPNYDAEKKLMTVYNVEPGATYKVAIVVEPVFDWATITIDSANAAQSGQMNTGVSLSSIFKSMEEKIGTTIADKIQISTLPLYMFCSVPDLPSGFVNPRFVGKIQAFIGDDDCNIAAGETPLYMLGSETSNGELTNSQIPALEKNQDDEVITNISTYKATPDSDLKTLLSSTAEGSLCVKYDVGFETGTQQGEITFSNEDIEALKATGSTSISLAAMLVLKLDFNVVNQFEMDVLKLINSDESQEPTDLLKRSEPTNLGNMEKYLSLIKSVQIEYEPSEIPFVFTGNTSSDSIGLVIDLDGDGTVFADTVLSLNKGKFEVNPSDMLDIYPLVPKMNVKIPKGNLKFPREMTFKTKMWLGVKTDGEIEVWSKNKSSTSEDTPENDNEEGGNE